MLFGVLCAFYHDFFCASIHTFCTALSQLFEVSFIAPFMISNSTLFAYFAAGFVTLFMVAFAALSAMFSVIYHSRYVMGLSGIIFSIVSDKFL